MIKEERNLGVTTNKCAIQKQLINFLINNLFCRYRVAMATAFPGDSSIILCVRPFFSNQFFSLLSSNALDWACLVGF